MIMDEQPQEVRIRTPRQGEVLGLVESMLGAGRLRVRCQDGKARLGRIPGKLRKKVWIRIGDYVILKPWDIQGDTNGDVVWRYTSTESNALRRKGILTM
ncbi:MAG: translation initiation factor eIF-1A [Candidatus Aenigmarchaeota archaeon]|nr:translation initiation factor eIF-1A [Candidatus Aenigmarchaeota archaeon]